MGLGDGGILIAMSIHFSTKKNQDFLEKCLTLGLGQGGKCAWSILCQKEKKCSENATGLSGIPRDKLEELITLATLNR